MERVITTFWAQKKTGRKLESAMKPRDPAGSRKTNLFATNHVVKEVRASSPDSSRFLLKPAGPIV